MAENSTTATERGSLHQGRRLRNDMTEAEPTSTFGSRLRKAACFHSATAFHSCPSIVRWDLSRDRVLSKGNPLHYTSCHPTPPHPILITRLIGDTVVIDDNVVMLKSPMSRSSPRPEPQLTDPDPYPLDQGVVRCGFWCLIHALIFGLWPYIARVLTGTQL